MVAVSRGAITYRTRRPQAPGTKNVRPGCTKFWRDLILLRPYNNDPMLTYNVARAPAKLSSVYAGGNEGAAGTRYFVKDGEFGGGLERDASQSLTISSNWKMLDMINSKAADYGLTVMIWGRQTAASVGGADQLGYAGNYNNAFGWSIRCERSSTSINAMNGTASRGFGDNAGTQYSASADCPDGFRYCGIGSFGTGGRVAIAGRPWDLTGHRRTGTAQIDGTYSPPLTTQMLTYGWGGRFRTGGVAIWKGVKISEREAAHITELPNPAQIFYG